MYYYVFKIKLAIFLLLFFCRAATCKTTAFDGMNTI